MTTKIGAITERRSRNQGDSLSSVGWRRGLGSGGTFAKGSPSRGPFVPPQGLGVRQSSGAFDHPRLPQRQRTGALQNAGATKLGFLRFGGASRGLSRAVESLPTRFWREEGRATRSQGSSRCTRILTDCTTDCITERIVPGLMGEHSFIVQTTAASAAAVAVRSSASWVDSPA